MISCSMPNCQTTAGCQCGYREVNHQWPVAKTFEKPAADGFSEGYLSGLAAGRLAGLREAAGVARKMYVRDAFRFEFGNDMAAAILALAGETTERASD